MSDCLDYQLSNEDIDVILAGLRLLQRTAEGDVSDWDIPEEIKEIAGESLDLENVDRLCERLNFGGSSNESAGDERDVLINRVRAELSRPEWDSDTAANLATALADAGWPTFLPEHEGWYLDVEDGAYTVVARSDGPFRSNAEAMKSIALQFAGGSQWHGQVLDTIGLTACGHGLPLMKIVGLAPNSIDVMVCNEFSPESCLEIGYRPDPFAPSSWSIFRRDPATGEASWVADKQDCRSALAFSAEQLGVSINEEVVATFSKYFQ